ncbi:MAG: hypothetical protein K6G25_01450, partial [Bacteroidales bacterium]|nr:hypothetical protein [Bacteroidales bacterium]
GSALMFSIGVPSIKVPIPDAASRGAGLVLASDFQRTSLSESPLVSPPVPSESGCKSTAFSITRNIFFRFFETFLYCADCQYIKTSKFYKIALSRREKSILSPQKGHILTVVYRKLFMILRSKQGIFHRHRSPFLATP